MSYVCSLVGERVLMADWTRCLKQSALRELLALASGPDMLSFALGMPASDLFPAEAYAQAAARALATDPQALQYGMPYLPLKEHIVALMAQRGVKCKSEEVFLTSGAQQAMSLLARLLLESHGEVIIEETAYDGMQTVLKPFQAEILTVPVDVETGMDVDAVESLLAAGSRPAFIYAITDGHNPIGVSMSADKRSWLVELAVRNRVPIIEDDAYGLLCYETESTPPLRALNDDMVFYVGSFSKILAPGLRVGWLIVPEDMTSTLSVARDASDMDTSSFAQRTISAFLDAGHMPEHIDKLRREYRARRDAMLRALEDCFPDEARWRSPSSGLFIWVEMPITIDTGQLLREAAEKARVVFIPGEAFCVPGHLQATNCLRLSFSTCAPDRISEGILRLSRVLKQQLVRMTNGGHSKWR